MDKVIIIGGVGTGTIIAQAIDDANQMGYSKLCVAGFMSHDKEIGEKIENYEVIVKQSKENVIIMSSEGYKFIYALHRMDGGKRFTDLYEELGLQPNMMATFVHPRAYVAPNVILKEGVVVMPYAMLSASTVVDCNTLVMTGVTIGHNASIGSFNHLASQSVVGSYTKTGISTHFGLNCTTREYLTIGSYTTIGMGAVLTKNVSDQEIWVGNPAKFLRKSVL